MTDYVQVSLSILQKQFGHTNVAELVKQRGIVFDRYFGNVQEKFRTEILDFNTCIPDALDYYWGRIFKITRTFTSPDGTSFNLNDEQFRELIKIRAFGTTWDGSVVSFNLFLNDIFGSRGSAMVIDQQDMTTQVVAFNFLLEPWESYLFSNFDIFPRPAGVLTSIREFSNLDYFGFNGTNYKPFGIAPFRSI